MSTKDYVVVWIKQSIRDQKHGLTNNLPIYFSWSALCFMVLVFLVKQRHKINLFWQSVKISFDIKWNVCLFQSKKCIVVKPWNEIKCYFMIKVLWALLQKHSWNLLQTHFFLLNYFEDVTWWIKYELACHFIHTLFRKKKKEKNQEITFWLGRKPNKSPLFRTCGLRFKRRAILENLHNSFIPQASSKQASHLFTLQTVWSINIWAKIILVTLYFLIQRGSVQTSTGAFIQ